LGKGDLHSILPTVESRDLKERDCKERGLVLITDVLVSKESPIGRTQACDGVTFFELGLTKGHYVCIITRQSQQGFHVHPSKQV